MTQLFLNGVEIPLTRGSYKENRGHYQITGQTEAGTNRRDLIRAGILGLSVKLTADSTTKVLLEGYNEETSLTVKYYDESTQTLVSWDAYMDGLSSDLITDGEWDCSFNLVDLEQ